MVAAHHVADDLRALPVLGVGRQVLLPHRVEDAALHRLQAVAHVGQRARGDDRQRVVEVARLRRLVQRRPVRSVPAPLPPREQRRAGSGVRADRASSVGVEVVEERLVAGSCAWPTCAEIVAARRRLEGQDEQGVTRLAAASCP